MNSHPLTLDVREDLRCGREPFSRIMKATAEVLPGEQFLLIAPFEPVPLFRVLEKQGFSYSTRQVSEGHWETVFTRQSSVVLPQTHLEEPRRPQDCSRTPSPVADVDARGLEPPEPLIRILESLSGLSPGAILRALTDRRPVHLYSRLAERGFTAQTHQQTDGSFVTHIRHA